MRPIIDRVGEVHVTNEGCEIEVTECFGNRNCTIRFKDGLIMYNIQYGHIRGGRVRKLVNRLGEMHFSREGEEAEIIEYINADKCTIKFLEGVTLENIQYGHVIRNNFSNPYRISVLGVGFLGAGKFSRKTHEKTYQSWSGLLTRAYSLMYHEVYPTYVGCSVDPTWYNFQNFANWYEENYNPETMQGWHLDKDIIFKGNKINSLLTKCDSLRGEYPIGVQKRNSRYKATININNISVHLGTFDTVKEAFQAYETAKEGYIKGLAEKWKPQLTPETYQALINYKVEITD